MFEVDEQEWGELGRALIQSLQQVSEGEAPVGPPNSEYCWIDEPGHTGGWWCVHPDCTVSPYTDEREIQALERLDQHLDGDREVEEEDEEYDSPDDPVCDCGMPMKSLRESFGTGLVGHIKDCNACGGKGTLHITKSSQFCISCGHGRFVDAQDKVSEWKGWDGKDLSWEERERLNDLERLAYCGYED